MVDWEQVLYTAGFGIAAALIIFLFARQACRTWIPALLRHLEVTELRAVCIKLLDPKAPHQKYTPLALAKDREDIEKEKDVEYLRFYTRFLPHYRVGTLWRVVTNLSSDLPTDFAVVSSENFGDAEMAVYSDFMNEFASLLDRYAKDDHALTLFRDFRTSKLYAVTHLELAPLILSVMQEREIYDLATIKQLVDEMQSAPSALSEGAL